MQHSAVRQPVYILLGTILSLSFISLIPTKKIFPSFIKEVNIFSEFKKDSSSKIISEKANEITTDVSTEKNKKYNELEIQNFGLQNNNYALSKEKIKSISKSKPKIRIAYLGDSFIESDLITNDLRQLLQQKYGGDGIGFININTVSPGMQKSIEQSFSSNWQNYNVHDNNSNKTLGLAGYAFEANDNSAVNFKTKKPYGKFNEVYLWYGNNATSLPIEILADSLTTNILLPASEKILNKEKLNIAAANTLQAKFNTSNTLLYGFSFEDSVGVYVDNYSLRGSNGTQLLKMDSSYMQALAAIQQYDMVILHYGVNVIGNNNTNFDWYKIGLNKTIVWTKNNFKNAAIVLVSTSDKCTKTNGVYQTDKGVPVLVDLQKELAQKNNIAFWNLYQNMGGNNSMIDWVNSPEPLANKDYTHITFKGAAKIAQLLYNQLSN